MYKNVVVNSEPLLVTNASCCSDGNAMCERCRAAALAAMPTPPAGLIDNDFDENDVLVLPSSMPSRAETQVALDAAWCTHNASSESDDDVLPSVAPPLPTKVTCPQCSGTGTTVEENSPNAQFALPNRTVECNLCEGRGFGIEGGVDIDSAAPHLAAAMADRQMSNTGRPLYPVTPVTNLPDDFDENDILLPNQL